jgi:hypothetical protein
VQSPYSKGLHSSSTIQHLLTLTIEQVQEQITQEQAHNALRINRQQIETYYNSILHPPQTRTTQPKELTVAALLNSQPQGTRTAVLSLSPVGRVMLYERLLALPIYIHSTSPTNREYYVNALPPLTHDLLVVSYS